MEAQTTERPQSPPRRTRVDLAAGLATAAAVLALIVLVPALRHSVGLALHGHIDALRTYIRSLVAGGLALILGLMVAHAVVFYPSEIVTATAGYIYGFGPALGLVIVGWLLTALLSYALGRSIGGPLLRSLLGKRFSRLVDDGGRLPAAHRAGRVPGLQRPVAVAQRPARVDRGGRRGAGAQRPLGGEPPPALAMRMACSRPLVSCRS